VPISRRTLFRQLGAAAAVSVAAPSLAARARPIRLDRNANAYGPSEGALAAMREAVNTVRYPDVEAELLKGKIASVHRVKPEQVILGAGSGEILRMAVDAFAGPRKKLIVATPTFEPVGQYARRRGVDVAAVPLKKDHSHDLDGMLARSDATTGLLYVCNPNNPTGTLTSRRDLEAVLARLPATTHVLIDEAYQQYAGESPEHASFIDRPVGDRRVIVARSFSKIYGLGSMRIGYAIASAETSALLAAHRLSGEVNVAAAMAAAAAIDDVAHVRRSMNRNVDDRQEFYNQANARMLRTIDSQTNFVMLKVAHSATDVVQHFRKHAILIGPVFPGFEKYVRVSMGTADQMNEFWRVWDLMPGSHHMA
jgi:histidinol-phosphate aminotransferase